MNFITTIKNIERKYMRVEEGAGGGGSYENTFKYSREVLDQFRTAINTHFNQNFRQNAVEGYDGRFTPLTQSSLLSTKVSAIQTAMNEILRVSDESITALSNMIDEVEGVESAITTDLATTGSKSGGSGRKSGVNTTGITPTDTASGTSGGGQASQTISDIGKIFEDEETLKDFIEFIKTNSNIDLSALLTNPENKDKLAELLKKFLESKDIKLSADVDLTKLAPILLAMIAQSDISQLITPEVQKNFVEYVKANSKVDLATLLTDPAQSVLAITLLLKSMGLSDADIAKIIKNIDTKKASISLLKAYIISTPEMFGLNNETKNTLNSILGRIAAEKGITVDQLLKDPQYADLLKNQMGPTGDIKTYLDSNVANQETLQGNVAAAYNGSDVEATKLDPSSVTLLREYIDNVAKKHNITPEALLCDKANEKILNSSVNSLQQMMTTVSNVAKHDSADVQSIMSTISNPTTGSSSIESLLNSYPGGEKPMMDTKVYSDANA